jgi:hypothetical protein
MHAQAPATTQPNRLSALVVSTAMIIAAPRASYGGDAAGERTSPCPDQDRAERTSFLIPALATGGAGLLFSGLGASFLGVAASWASDGRASELTDDRRALEIAGGTFLGFGAAALVTSGLLFDVHADLTGQPQLQLMPLAGTSGGGLQLVGSF